MTVNSTTKIGRLALIGVGLIGGSLARALRRAGAVNEIVGCARSQETLDHALALGVVDTVEHDPAAAVAGADMVVVAVPVLSSGEVLSAIAPALQESAVVTDVGSVKAHVVAAAQTSLAAHFSRFVPGHPIAGTENSGVAASFAELYQGKHVVLTPVAGVTDPGAVQQVSAMWSAVGADVLQMGIDEHDKLLAMTSHLPHVLAYILVGYLAQQPRTDDLFELAAAGFYDFTRIASSDPRMWRDICVGNKDAIAAALTGFRAQVDQLLGAIESGDGDRLMDEFQRAKHARDKGMAGKKT